MRNYFHLHEHLGYYIKPGLSCELPSSDWKQLVSVPFQSVPGQMQLAKYFQ